MECGWEYGGVVAAGWVTALNGVVKVGLMEKVTFE